MLRYATRFPISTGWVVSSLKSGLAAASELYAAGVVVQPKRPVTMPQRLITVRNDGGPDDGFVGRRRLGVNVWADTSEDAENLALLAGAILRKAPASGNVSYSTEITAPYEIEDDPDLTWNGTILSHWYFTAAVIVRAINF